MKFYDEIYKFDTKKNLRVWYMEQDGSCHRTIAGLVEGKLVVSGWTQCETTNAGRANERDPVAQATFEIEASYQKKLTREYHRTVEGAGGGAHFFKPMLAEKYVKFASGFAQPKLDGIRCIATKAGLWTRQGKPITGAPHIREALAPYFERDADLILDGELYNHDLKDDFDTVTSIVRQKTPTAEEIALSANVMQYHIYDIPSVKATFGARLVALNELFEADKPTCIHVVETLALPSEADYDQLHGEWLEQGYEGSIWRADAAYEQKRSNNLRKRKEFQDAEFEVVRIEAGLGNWAGRAKRVICRLEDGREFGAGIKGSRARGAELLHEKHKIVTLKFFRLTPDGIPRFAVATKFHGEERTL